METIEKPPVDRTLDQYFVIPLTGLVPNKEVPFDVFLIFPLTQVFTYWVQKKTIVTDLLYDDHKDKGLETVWLLKSDRQKYLEYRKKYKSLIEKQEALDRAKRKLGKKKLTDEDKKAIKDEFDGLNEDQKKKLKKREEKLSDQAKKELAEIREETLHANKHEDLTGTEAMGSDQKKNAKDLDIDSESSDKKENDLDVEKTRKDDPLAEMANEIVDKVKEAHDIAIEEKKTVTDEFETAQKQVNPDSEHGKAVSAYATILALKFELAEKESDLKDLASAGLLHDIGLSQIPVAIARKNWGELNTEEKELYFSSHQKGLNLIEAFGSKVNSRTRQFIEISYGFEKTQDKELQKYSDILSFCDLLDTVYRGRWDGTERTIRDSLDFLSEISGSELSSRRIDEKTMKAFLEVVSEETFEKAS